MLKKSFKVIICGLIYRKPLKIHYFLDVGAADSEENLSHAGSGDSIKKKFGYNFIAEDFQGVSLHRTICLECEAISELKEPFLEIQASFFLLVFLILQCQKVWILYFGY